MVGASNASRGGRRSPRPGGPGRTRIIADRVGSHPVVGGR